MKVECDVCGAAPASVVCPADHAALCVDCDACVHSANKLATKHQRLPLIGHEPPSTCDICQDKPGYFLCLDDRAVLCRECDLSIHSAKNLASKHKRFFLPTITVGLMPLIRIPPLTDSTIVTPLSAQESIITSTTPPSPPSTQRNQHADNDIAPPRKETCADSSFDSLASKIQSQPNMSSCDNVMSPQCYTTALLVPASQHNSHDNITLPQSYNLPPLSHTPSSNMTVSTMHMQAIRHQIDATPSNSIKYQTTPTVNTNLSDNLTRLDNFLNLPELPLTTYTEDLPKMGDFGVSRNGFNSGHTFDSSVPSNLVHSITSTKVTSSLRLKRQLHTSSSSEFDNIAMIPEAFRPPPKKPKAFLEA